MQSIRYDNGDMIVSDAIELQQFYLMLHLIARKLRYFRQVKVLNKIILRKFLFILVIVFSLLKEIRGESGAVNEVAYALIRSNRIDSAKKIVSHVSTRIYICLIIHNFQDTIEFRSGSEKFLDIFNYLIARALGENKVLIFYNRTLTCVCVFSAEYYAQYLECI